MTHRMRVGIIGSGFSGLAIAAQLERSGLADYTILERAGSVGGTWRENTYPGAACDTPSHLYSYSFAPKTDWSRKWATQPEILAYIEQFVAKEGLTPHLELNREVTRARFDESDACWHVSTKDGPSYVFDILVSGVGQLARPRIPTIRGQDAFHGESFHSAEWQHDIDLANKRVAVIGNGASAVQFVPEIVDRVAKFHLFSRSMNWIVPKNDHRYGDLAQKVFAQLPAIAKAYRSQIWLDHEWRFGVFTGPMRPTFQWISRSIAAKHLESQVADPELRRRLTPDYPVGTKRILITDDFYPALTRPHSELVTDAIEEIVPNGVKTADGKVREVDVIIYATGFKSTQLLAPMEIVGSDDTRLDEAWAARPRTHLGITAPGVPNFFMMYGPNTNLGHNSIIFMLECQTRYILDALRQMNERGLLKIELEESAADAFVKEATDRLARTVWADGDATNWYKTADGVITNNWIGTTAEYWYRTRSADLSMYRCVEGPRLENRETGTASAINA